MHVHFGFDAKSAAGARHARRGAPAGGQAARRTPSMTCAIRTTRPAGSRRAPGRLIARGRRGDHPHAGRRGRDRGRWGREPVVLPHPHVIEFERFRPRPSDGDVDRRGAREERAGEHGAAAGHRRAGRRRAGSCRVPGCRSTSTTTWPTPDGARHDPELMRWLREPNRPAALELAVHDYFSDEELWAVPGVSGPLGAALSVRHALGMAGGLLRPGHRRPGAELRLLRRAASVSHLPPRRDRVWTCRRCRQRCGPPTTQRPALAGEPRRPARGAADAGGRPSRALRRGAAMSPRSGSSRRRGSRSGSPSPAGWRPHVGPRRAPAAARARGDALRRTGLRPRLASSASIRVGHGSAQAARADVSMRAPDWLDEHHAYLS